MAENYKHLYEQTKKMLAMYQDELVPGFRKEIEGLEGKVCDLRKKWQAAETHICTMCEHFDHKTDGNIVYGNMTCGEIVGYPCCGKFKLRATDNNVGSKWIPVTERLPDESGIYLVVVKYKYDFEKEYTYDTDVATFHFDDSGNIDTHWATYVDWDEGQQYLHVTNWMPLPEAPIEERK